MKKLLFLYAAVALLGSLGLRARVARLHWLDEAAGSDEEGDFTLLARDGVAVDEATVRAAARHARKHGLKVVDLWPADMPAREWLRLLFAWDPDKELRRRFGRVASARQALVVEKTLVEKAAVTSPADPVAFQRLATRLRRYSGTAYGVAVANGVHGDLPGPRWRRALHEEPNIQAAPGAFTSELFVIALPFMAGLKAGWAGLVLFAASILQPLVALGGTAVKPPGLLLLAFFNLPIELYDWLRAVFLPRRPQRHEGGELRAEYQSALAGGTDRFFEPRAELCPFCGATDLQFHVRTHDLIQGKPGMFTLERCVSCGHVFQNPRLTSEGLDFYYRDAYSGVGGVLWESLFDLEEPYYMSRAKRVPAGAMPSRWLDVGTAYGHFCAVAREVWPATRFDGLDIGNSLAEGTRRGWIDEAIQCSLTQLAGSRVGAYDVVSMSHYLEHTLDPKAEIAAASKLLRPGGYLLIEVPSLKSLGAKLAGRYWYPWFQPQHLHFLTQDNFRRVLAEEGMDPVRWDFLDAHFPNEIGSAMLAAMDQLAPKPDLPWRPKTTLRDRIVFWLTWGISPLVLAPANILDLTVGYIPAYLGMSMNFSVLAQKSGHYAPPSGESLTGENIK